MQANFGISLLLLTLVSIHTTFQLSIPSDAIKSENLIPKISMQDLQSIVKKSLDGVDFSSFENLKDAGGNFGVLEISRLGNQYENALKVLQNNAASCINNSSDSRIPPGIALPDGSYRKTYATTNKTYLDCLDMDLLSQTFDEIESAIMEVIMIFGEHYFDELELQCSQIAYQVDGTRKSIANAIEKEHIHVYSKKEQSNDLSSDTDSIQSMVPFHTDNGLFLIITPFQEHGMNVKLSDGSIVSTNNLGSDSALVLIGRGLTDWLLSPNIASSRHIFAVPHSVPTLTGTGIESRTVYARMKIPQRSATSAMAGCHDFDGTEKIFEDFFLDR